MVKGGGKEERGSQSRFSAFEGGHEVAGVASHCAVSSSRKHVFLDGCREGTIFGAIEIVSLNYVRCCSNF